MEAPRRSARLRGIAPTLEDREKSVERKPTGSDEGLVSLTDPVTPGTSPETAGDAGATPRLGSQLDVTNIGKCSVVLNRLKIEEDYHSEDEEKREEKKEDGEKDEFRKIPKPLSSRIPTFQSTASRRRPVSQGPDTSAQVKGDASSLLTQSWGIGKGSAGGHGSKVRVSTGGDSALPRSLTRLPIGDTTDMSAIHRQPDESLSYLGLKEPLSCSLETDILTHKMSTSGAPGPMARHDDSLPSQPPVLTPRPALRTDSPDPETLLLPSQKLSVQMEDILAGSPLAEEQEEEPEQSQVHTDIVTGSSATRVYEEENRQVVHQETDWDEVRDPTDFDPLLIESTACASDVSETVGPQSEKVPAKERDLRCRLDTSRQVRSVGESAFRKGSKERQPSVPNTDEPAVRSSQSVSSGQRRIRPPSTVCRVSCCLVLTTLLLLGGLGLHLWRYGTPVSVSELLEQVDLGWLENLWGSQPPCSSDCSFSLLESLPEGLHFEPGSPTLPPISQAWQDVLSRANSSVSIAAFYFTLRASDIGLKEPSASEGELVFKQLMELESRGVKLQVAVNSPQSFPQDTEDFSKIGAEVRPVDLQNATGGIVHTKLWAVDHKHFYLGSANMDWRSLTQVKEVAVLVENCSCLAEDASRLFGVYWYLGDQGGRPVPRIWPARYSALSSSQRPLLVKLNSVPARVYLSSSPPPLAAYGRTDDLSAILSVIYDAQKFVYISVMDYLPFSEFTQPKRFWPSIDLALRDVACSRHVEVNLMVSCWPHSNGAMFVFLKSLAVLRDEPLQCSIQVRVFVVPSTSEQSQIPFARVNHAKFMVTDRAAYIGTSNWSENYFTHTAGVGLVVNHTGLLPPNSKGERHSVQSQLKDVFMRDWTSKYSHSLSEVDAQHCAKHM